MDTVDGMSSAAEGPAPRPRNIGTQTLARGLRALELGSTVSLLVEEGQEAVALAVVEPANARYHVSFREGSRHPLDRGSAGIALRMLAPPRPGDPTDVSRARELGFASTHGQVEPGAYGVAVPLPPEPGMPACCVNVITYRADVAGRAVEPVRRTVGLIADALTTMPADDPRT